MPFEFSKAEVIRKNNTAIEACELSIARLKGMIALPESLEGERLVELGRATDERTQLRAVNAHYKAAGTVVKPMADQVAAELNDLGNKLDKQIEKDAIIDATIDFIGSVLTDVGRLRSITNSHKG